MHLLNKYYTIQWNNEGSFNCTKEFSELVGYSDKEISHLPYKHHSLLDNGLGSEIHNSILESLNDPKQQLTFDIEIVASDGKSHWYREIISIVREINSMKYQSILFDITDLKENEGNLNEIINTKTDLNSSKDKLISIISHDLRAPFTSLLGFSEILLNEPNLPEEERSEYLKYIHDASEIQLQMVNHLLDWTRLQTGTMKFEPQRINIKDIIDNAVSVLTGSVIRKEIEIKVKGDPTLYVSADERLINQVVTNLLSNAVKFTPSGKKIKVTIELFKNSMVEVIVADEGVGIDEKHQDKLFRIDAKFSKAGTDGEKGSGFGLTLVKEIIEKHNGNIWFYSEINKGSEFHFTLPRAEDTILMVEENEDLQKIYREHITEQHPNFSIDFSKNGVEVLNKILKKIPALLITYHQMPLMNGIQLVSSLRKKDIHNKVKVLVICDNLTDNEKNKYNDYNVKRFLSITASVNEISDEVSKLII